MSFHRIWIGNTTFAAAQTTPGEFADFHSLHYIKKLKQLKKFELTIFNVISTQKPFLVQGNRIWITKEDGSTVVFRGELRVVKRDDETDEYSILGYGREVTIQDHVYPRRNTQWAALADGAAQFPGLIIYNASDSKSLLYPLVQPPPNGDSSIVIGTLEGIDGASADAFPYRAENQPVLNLIAGLADTSGLSTSGISGFDWDVDEDTATGKPRFNFKQRIGSTAVTDIYQIGNQIDEIQRDKDIERVFNNIIVLGSGDGRNQIVSRNFHATTNRTFLTSAMSESAPDTINVASTTSFSSAGDLWIGMEKVHYTSKTATSFTGISRGTQTANEIGSQVKPGSTSGDAAGSGVIYSGQSTYTHNIGIEVYDATVTKSNPQAGSSISTNGLRENSFTDLSIIDQNTVDQLAQRLLAKYKDPIERVVLRLNSDFVPSAELGDNIAVQERDASSTLTSNVLSGSSTLPVAEISDFVTRVDGSTVTTSNSGTVIVGTNLITYTGVSVTSGPGNLTGCTGVSAHSSGEEVFLGSVYRALGFEYFQEEEYTIVEVGRQIEYQYKELSDLKKDMSISNAYGHGATNIYTTQGFDNIKGGTHPLVLDLFIPAEAVSINAIRVLNLRLRPFRQSSAGTPSTQTSSSVNNKTTTTSNSSVGYLSGSSASVDFFVQIPQPISGQTFVKHTFYIKATNSSGTSIITESDMRVHETNSIPSTLRELILPDALSIGVDSDSGSVGSWTTVYASSTTTNHADKYVRFLFRTEDNTANGTLTVTGVCETESTHSHTIPGQQAPANIVETPYSSPSVGIKIDNTDLTTVLGGPWSSDTSNIDLHQYVNTTGLHTLEFFEQTADKLGRIHASVFVQCFVRSK